MDGIAPPSCSTSGGGRPPRPTTAPTPTRCRAFVAPHPRATTNPPDASLPHRQEAPSPRDVMIPRHQLPSSSSGLPRRLPNGPPPLGHHVASFTEPPQFSSDITWDVGSTTSSPAAVYDYEGTNGDYSPNRIVHSTSDYCPNEPRASSSQYFTNLMTQEVTDDDLVLLVQPDATPSSGGKGASKRGSNYTLNEDIQLCISWMNVSNDPVTGNDQSGKTYWQRIANDFHKNKDFESDRTPSSLEHCCGVIIKECTRFQGYYKEVERRHPSGVSYQEHMLQAQSRYARASKGKTCQFIHCWLKVRHCEKFTSIGVNKRPSKSTRELNLPTGSQQEDEGRQEASQVQESSSIPATKKARPPGKKQSKQKLKNNEGDVEYMGMMHNLVVMKTEEHKMKKERWNKDMELEERRIELKEKKLQWKLEEKVIFCDVSNMDNDQRTYVTVKRAQIAKAVSANIGENAGASAGDSGESRV